MIYGHLLLGSLMFVHIYLHTHAHRIFQFDSAKRTDLCSNSASKFSKRTKIKDSTYIDTHTHYECTHMYICVYV